MKNMKNRVLISNIRITPRCRLSGLFLLPAILLSLASCAPPVGNGDGNEGNLTISLGTAGGGRFITSGKDLPADVLAAMRYDLTLTGPGGEVHKRSVSGGQTVSLNAALGNWRVDAAAYQDQGVLAGTGSLAFTVRPGGASVMVPMSMNGPCYEITLSNDTVHGTVRSNFTAAFPGTTITLTAEKDPDAFFVDGTLDVLAAGNPVTVSGSGTTGSFIMPGEDVKLYAGFRQFVRYVRAGEDGSGESWEDASGDIQAMMDELATLPAAYTGPRIVKLGAGTYLPQYAPDSNGNSISEADLSTAGRTTRDMAFFLRPGVQVWGGYPAGGGSDASRNPNPATNTTILSGDIDPGSSGDDAYHVVLGVNIPANSGTVLDGLTISGGNANDGGSYITVDSVQINRCYGGGMYNTASSPALVNVTISGNSASAGFDGGGGGMYNTASSPVLVNTIFSGNSADSAGSGGGMYNNNSSSPVLVNTIFSGNSAGSDGSGGGMYNGNSLPTLVNVTISGNYAQFGGGMFNSNASLPKVRNSIIWGNESYNIYNFFDNPTPIYTYSLVQGENLSGEGNKDGTGSSNDPKFATPKPYTSAPTTEGDYHLESDSPVKDQGSNNLYPTASDIETLLGQTLSAEVKAAIDAALAKDLGGSPRKQGIIDMGAYEF